MADDNWYVYIIEATDSTYYTGITTDVLRRWQQHSNQQGAKYFRGRLPQQLLFVEAGHNRSSASQREMAIKKLKRKEKYKLLNSPCNCAGLFQIKLSQA
ncbi:GIY-YIG nuclease family protein [Marinicella sp. W31]|uniref:GIY-YIG nuclease family protein n=1 Tax=Marinicella sp. W31 TaxID=3023713 RepID=UPI003757115E